MSTQKQRIRIPSPSKACPNCGTCPACGKKPRVIVRIGNSITEWARVEITRDSQPVKLREPAR